MLDDNAQAYLKDQMEKYFFSEGDIDDIKGYNPE
jgi:Fe-S cluster biosynthesis and repair protein YggX